MDICPNCYGMKEWQGQDCPMCLGKGLIESDLVRGGLHWGLLLFIGGGLAFWVAVLGVVLL